MSDLGIKARRVDDVTILDTDGRLRIRLRFGGSSVTLASAIVDLLDKGQSKILLNLDGVNVIGARELGELVSATLEAKKGGGEFKLFNLTPTTRQVMLSTKLLTVLEVCGGEAQALKSFSDSATLETALLPQ